MKAVQEVIGKFNRNELDTLQKGGNVTIHVDDTDFTLTPEDVEVERNVHEGMVAANSQKITIALDTTLTDELLLEGIAREIVNKINTMRRDKHLDVVDRIHVKMKATDRVKQCFAVFGDSIKNEILALTVDFGDYKGEELDLNGELTIIQIEKANR